MKTTGQTDYRKVDAAAVYEAKKIVIRLCKFKRSVEEIMEVTDFFRDAVYSAISAYKKGWRRTDEKERLLQNKKKNSSVY